MRLFVGIALADAVRRELQLVATRLRSSSGPAISGIRWTAPESWHITLQFLGNATAEQFACLTARLSEIRSARVPIALGAIGCFDRAGVIIVEVNTSPELAALAERVIAATSQCGFVAETRPFHPHITLARTKGSRSGAGLPFWAATVRNTPSFSRFAAKEFLLYESHLSREGARYEVRGRFSLGQSDDGSHGSDEVID